MYNPKYTKAFYNAYGEVEWNRLERSAYGRLQSIIHADFIQRYLKSSDRVLDAGSGPGRFSIVAGQIGAKVTVLDISDTQLAIAKEKLSEARLLYRVDQFIEADVTDLSMFPANHFDLVICFGGALSYVCELRQKAVKELLQVSRPGAIILVSVMSRIGSFLLDVQKPNLPLLREPDKSTSEQPGLWQPLKTGDLYGFPSRSIKLIHAPMHLYTAEELASLFDGYQILEIAGSNVTVRGYSSSAEQIAADPKSMGNSCGARKKNQ